MFDAIGYFLSALRLAREPGMRRWVILPLTFNILLFGVLYWLAGSALGGWIASLGVGIELQGGLAHYPAHSVNNVGFATAVRPDHCSQVVRKRGCGRINERFETGELDAFQSHGVRNLPMDATSGGALSSS